MLVMTDGDFQPNEDPTNEWAVLIGVNINIFSLGLGAWLKTGSVRALASKRSYYGLLDDWTSLLSSRLSSVSSGQ